LSNRIIYLTSYDLYVEVLAYRLPEGTFTILTRDDFIRLGIQRSFGTFSREGEHVAGVFASPTGPVLFLDSRHLVGRLGCTHAKVEPAAGSMLQFTLTHEEKIEFSLVYRDRPGIGVNPYDTEPEDVDMFAMLASGLRKEQFFRNYVKDWVTRI
jgi:hypothetical protein